MQLCSGWLGPTGSKVAMFKVRTTSMWMCGFSHSIPWYLTIQVLVSQYCPLYSSNVITECGIRTVSSCSIVSLSASDTRKAVAESRVGSPGWQSQAIWRDKPWDRAKIIEVGLRLLLRYLWAHLCTERKMWMSGSPSPSPSPGALVHIQFLQRPSVV